MKKIVFVFLVFCESLFLNAQIVGTPYGVIQKQDVLLLDLFPNYTPSFAFSTRKLRANYTGPAIRLYRITDQSEVDVAFDDNGVVSANSVVTFVTSGSSGITVGTTSTLSVYKGSNELYSSIWYDQGANANHAIQNTPSLRPIFELDAAGNLNQYSALRFTGTLRHHLEVNQPVQNLLGNVSSTTNGLYASIGLIAKPTVSSSEQSNNSFGFFNSSNNSLRWSAHLNWPGGGLFTDFGNSADSERVFVNTSNQNIYKQYTFVRYPTTKSVRFSGRNGHSALTINQTLNTGNGITGGSFGIGVTLGNLTNQNGYFGYFSEFVLFKEPFTLSEIVKMEKEQLNFWKCTN